MALPGRLGTVGEDMAKVSAAVGAMDFGTRIAELEIPARANRTGHRFPETWPAGARLVFGFRTVERISATGAGESSRSLLVIEGRGIGTFGCRIAQHVELALGQFLAPLRLG